MKFSKFNKKEVLSLQDIQDFFKDNINYSVKEARGKDGKVRIVLTNSMVMRPYYGETLGERPTMRGISQKYYLYKPTLSDLIIAISSLT